jgi:hypothetical protein
LFSIVTDYPNAKVLMKDWLPSSAFRLPWVFGKRNWEKVLMAGRGRVSVVAIQGFGADFDEGGRVGSAIGAHRSARGEAQSVGGFDDVTAAIMAARGS